MNNDCGDNYCEMKKIQIFLGKNSNTIIGEEN